MSWLPRLSRKSSRYLKSSSHIISLSQCHPTRFSDSHWSHPSLNSQKTIVLNYFSLQQGPKFSNFKVPREYCKNHCFDYQYVAHFSTESASEESSSPSNSKESESRSWIDLYLPEKTRPYAKLARLDKPIGTWLLAWPCMWYALRFCFSFYFH